MAIFCISKRLSHVTLSHFLDSPVKLVSGGLSPFYKMTALYCIIVLYITILYFYYSVQNLLSSSLLTKNSKIKIHRTIILPVVLYRCETWSLALREERRLSVFENRLLRRIFEPKRDEVTGKGENYLMRG